MIHNYKAPPKKLVDWLPSLGFLIGIIWYAVVIFCMCVAMAHARWDEACFWALMWVLIKLDLIKDKL